MALITADAISDIEGEGAIPADRRMAEVGVDVFLYEGG